MPDLRDEIILMDENNTQVNNDQELTNASTTNYKGIVGEESNIEKPDIDIKLFTSRESPVAGELWSMSGNIHNRSTKPFWIVNVHTVYTPAPEMWGLKSRRGSIGAFFPTIIDRIHHEVVRIDPGASYSVIWKITPLDEKDLTMGLFREISAILRNYAFFRPNNFITSATVHIWTIPPEFDNDKVINLGSSYPVSTIKEVNLDASPWVIIVGAAIGALFMYILQIIFGNSPLPSDYLGYLKLLFVGPFSAILLSSISTVLLSRLASLDFVVSIKIKDIWGAIASGFVIQYAGYPWLESVLSSVAK